MRIWRFHEHGPIENLILEEAPIPEPAAGEALLRVAYAGLNPADRFLVMGRYPGAADPPLAVGRDGSGIIEKPGDSGRFAAGDTVVLLRGTNGITRDGTLAEYVTVPESSLAPLPHWWSLADGAAGPLVLLTSWQALVVAAGMQTGETVVITGASGGIGTSSLLLTKALGGTAIALSRSADKRQTLLELGADHALDTEDPDLVTKVRDLGGADIVIENICGPFLNKSLSMCNSQGRICIIGGLGGVKSEINAMTVLFNRLQIHGIQVGEYSDQGLASAWQGITGALEAMEGKVPIDKVFPFEQVIDGFNYMRSGPMGKVVIGPVHEGTD